MRSFFYFVKEALLNSKKNFGTTFGAIVTIFLSLLVIGVFMVTSLVIERVVRSIESQVSISIFLADEAADGDVTALITFIDSLPEVASVSHVSKDQALENFKEMTSSGIVEQLDGNPLPASLEVELAEPDQVETVALTIQAEPVYTRVVDNPDNPADSIRYGQQIVKQLFAVTDIIMVVCIVLVVMLIFVALVFINNTIRLAILARRKEIAIMRLVGASNGFIRGPFLMEGALQSLIGAGMAILSIHLLASRFLPQLSELLSWLPIDYASMEIWRVYALLTAVGLVIGLFGSAWAMRRYLKV
ncbi:MAG: permease-like cell division protein FtsX [Coriobacteriia bacterium]|nr:permease-like cell division protein FtsX [Coriobacteriia bacterium]MCL2750318.1 permease-like cell division protein FtsX [Coriobacteriia bacterium]